MFLKKKSNVIFRNYNDFGYITDNRNFGYKKANHNDNHIGDKIISATGAIFFSVLDNTPQRLDDLASKINNQFQDTDINRIKTDAEEFYFALEQDGFVVSGATQQECEQKDIRFSYKASFKNEQPKGFYQAEINHGKSTQDYFEEYFGDKPQLTNLHIEITSKCNERCIHCYIPHEDKTTYIEPNIFYNILEQCKHMQVLHLTISGGEPMLHNNFRDFLRKCKEYNLSINILSNLTLLDNDILKEMKSNPLLGVQTSLYAMDPSVHDSITRMNGSFKKTKKAIMSLIENDIPLQISCPIMKQNINNYADVIEWAQKHNVHAGDDYTIIARYNNNTNNLNCRLSTSEVKELIHEKITSNTLYLKEIVEEAEKKKNTAPDDFICSVCNSSMCISDSGNIYPCAGWQGYVLGNIKENPLSEVWNNSEKVQYLRALRKYDFPKCLQCADKDFCTMCMVRNANENPLGNPLTVNAYFCEIARIMKQECLKIK